MASKGNALSTAVPLVILLLVFCPDCSEGFEFCMNHTFFKILELHVPGWGTLDLTEDVCREWTGEGSENGQQFIDFMQELYAIGFQSLLPSIAKPQLYLHTGEEEEIHYNVSWQGFHKRDYDTGLALIYQASDWAGTVGPNQFLNLTLAFTCRRLELKEYSRIHLVYTITTTVGAGSSRLQSSNVTFHLFFMFLCNDTQNINREYFGTPPIFHPAIHYSADHLHLKELRVVAVVLGVMVAATLLGLVYFECYGRKRWLEKYTKDPLGKEAGVASADGQSEGSFPFEGFQLHPSEIILGQEIGKGAFGVVYEGYLHSERVAVKTIKCGNHVTEDQISRFLEEAYVMAQFQHPNILNLVGICLEEGTAPQLVVPYMQNGDLHSYLKHFNPTITPGAVQLRFEQLLDFALQIAMGMAYLGKRNFVHRDLAARNCMLNSDMVVKVGDFGLGRDIQDEAYYKVNTEFMLPIKWMALESLQYYKFTTQSDVWSYGVVLWELMSLGQVPYAGVANHEILEHLKDGNRLAHPKLCMDRLYTLMLNCWASDALDRPTFSQVLSLLRSIDPVTYELVMCKPLYLHFRPEPLDLISNRTGSEMSFPLASAPSAPGGMKGSSSLANSAASTPATETSQPRHFQTLVEATSSVSSSTFKVQNVIAAPADDAAKTA